MRRVQGTNKMGRPSKKVGQNYYTLCHNVNFYHLQVDVRDLRIGMCMPSPEWVDQSMSSNDKLVACKLQHTGDQSVTVTRSVTVNGDLRWCVHVHGQALDPTKCNALKNFPVTI